jgi:hypothetical protein
MQQYNGTQPQSSRTYNTYTDASNGEWYGQDWTTTANTLTMGTFANGTGATTRNLTLLAGGALLLQAGLVINWYVNGALRAQLGTGTFQPNANAGLDLGSGTNGWKKLYIDYTNTATVGAVTINKASGRVNIAAAGTSITVTNSLVTAACRVQAWVTTNDSTARVNSVVPSVGSFTIYVTAPTAQCSFDFLVTNAD